MRRKKNYIKRYLPFIFYGAMSFSGLTVPS